MTFEIRRAALQDLCALVTDGTHDSPKLREDGVPFIKGKHISSGRIDFDTCDFISYEDHLEVIARSKPERGDTLFSNIGSVGDAAYVNTDVEFSIKNVALLKPDPSQIDPLYLFYLVRSDKVKGEILAAKSGSAQQFISLGSLRKHQVDVPASLETQQRIAAILGAYDDLIEVNRRRVAVLEEMARGLFEEWFVRFRFPGHEDLPIVDTPDGPLPEGWAYGHLRDVLALGSGFAFKSTTFVDEGQYSIVTIKHVHDGLLKPPFLSKINELPPKMPAHCKIKQGDILVSLTGNVGRTCLAWGEELLLNQRVAKVDPAAERYRSFAYCWFRSSNTLKRLQNIANGAAQQNLSPVQTVGLTLPIPPASVAEHFEKVVNPILDSIVTGHRSTEVLQRQRDLLLPRLISGQLSVQTAERQLEDAA
ncbi:restriction endonuclease subunit S [Pontixanthobacter luteolus]|uniref:restriction endonuclease subunit S n=1 Tax=Pontixanthobacter luteolus TaxID=295089 RepID=UPI002303D8D9|nr:restriction endonuclease subunit S [Pontixanthobacter luteolus]